MRITTKTSKNAHIINSPCKYLFSEADPKDLLSSRAPLAVDMVSTLPSKSKVVSMGSLEGSVGLKARGDLLCL